MMPYTKFESSGPCIVVLDKIFEKCNLKTFFDPVTYLSNQSKPFEQFW